LRARFFASRIFNPARPGANVPANTATGTSNVAEIILVRHGQANSHATDEISYDRLSDLGREQARWLGAHLRTTNPHFDQVITGTLTRQSDTARAMGYEITAQDARLDELSYFALADAMEAQHGIPAPRDPTEFAAHLPQVITHWTRGEITGVPETYDQFATRVTSAIDEICAAHGRILIVTSGGVIGMVMRHALGLENGGMAKIMLQIMNSSLHRLEYVHDMLMVGAFNATPHLDLPDRAHARTYV
jgi:broad specificity phosphatase PhoE